MDKIFSVRPISLGNNETLILVLSKGVSGKVVIAFGLRILFVNKRLFLKSDKTILRLFSNISIDQKHLSSLVKESPLHFEADIMNSKSNYAYILGKRYSINCPSDPNNINANDFSQVIKAIEKRLKPVLISLIDHFLSKLNLVETKYRIKTSKPHSFLARILYNKAEDKEREYSFKFCYLLGMFHPTIISSIVAHEVVHILHPNHGKEFKKLLTSIVPDYEYLSHCLTFGFVNGENNEYAE